MRHYINVFFFFALAFLMGSPAHAALVGAEDVAENIVDSASDLPALLSALSYLMGILLGVLAIFKTVEHVTNPNQTPLRVPLVRFFVGGALFALPMVFETVTTAFDGGAPTAFDPTQSGVDFMNDMNAILGIISVFSAVGTNFDAILVNIDTFIDDLPALVSALGYLLGIVLATSGVLRIKEHVEEPERVTLKEPVIRLLTAGALFALPSVFEAMYITITGAGLGLGGLLVGGFNAFNFLNSSETGFVPDCLGAFLGGNTLGAVVCNAMTNTISLPNFLTAIAYLLGLVFGVWGVLKVRDHVLNPMQTRLHEGVTRLLAGGLFFALPFIISAIQLTMTPLPIAALSVTGTNTGFTTTAALTCGVNNSLEEAMGCLMADVQGPIHVVFNFFCFIAGMILVMIGISRLIKSTQEGPRGPGGIGTVTTFAIAGILMSANVILRAASASLFGSWDTSTQANLTYAGGMTAAETAATYHVINAVLRFMFIIGILSFARGLFIIRNVAEGQQQASIMVAMTHIIGGALAVNLGPILNALQNTLGITAFGVTFT